MSTIASSYDDLQLFVAELCLDSPEEAPADEAEDQKITLSTVHSAKGLEWSAVLIIDLVEDRFPSRHAMVRPEDFEEERRLMYVACTRAKDTLDLFVPLSVYSRSSGGQEPTSPSPFVRELPSDILDEIYENYGGALSRRRVKEQDRPVFAGSSFHAPARRSWHWDEDGNEKKTSFRRNDEDDWPPREREEASPRSREDADDAYMAAVREAMRQGRALEETPMAT